MTRSAFSDDYIVRIYRRNRRAAHRFVGTVEEVGAEGKRAFTTIEELWGILSRKDRESKKLKGQPEE
jgi:hypothetical protein